MLLLPANVAVGLAMCMPAAPCAPKGLLLSDGLRSLCHVQALQGAQLQVPGLSREEWEVMQQGQAPTLGVAVLTSKQAEAAVPLATAVAALTAEALQAKVSSTAATDGLQEQWQGALAAAPLSSMPAPVQGSLRAVNHQAASS